MATTTSKPGVNTVKWWSPGDMTVNERLLFNAINDHDQAITTLATQGVPASTSTTTVISGGSGGGGVTPVVVNPFPGLGSVNNQVGLTAYTTQMTDNGALILIGDSSTIAITLNSALVTPYFTSISNAGTSTATLTPSTGTINGSASLTLPAGSWVTVYFDNVNWDAESPGTTAGGVSQLLAGAGITLTPAGGMGVVTVAASGGGGGVPRGALNTNSNGSWWVWGDGVIEAWGSISVAPNSTNQNSATIFFPTAFTTGVESISVNVVGFPRSGSTDSAEVILSGPPTLSIANIALQCSVPTGGGGVTFDQAVTVMWRAIGI